MLLPQLPSLAHGPSLCDGRHLQQACDYFCSCLSSLPFTFLLSKMPSPPLVACAIRISLSVDQVEACHFCGEGQDSSWPAFYAFCPVVSHPRSRLSSLLLLFNSPPPLFSRSVPSSCLSLLARTKAQPLFSFSFFSI